MPIGVGYRRPGLATGARSGCVAPVPATARGKHSLVLPSGSKSDSESDDKAIQGESIRSPSTCSSDDSADQTRGPQHNTTNDYAQGSDAPVSAAAAAAAATRPHPSTVKPVAETNKPAVPMFSAAMRKGTGLPEDAFNAATYHAEMRRRVDELAAEEARTGQGFKMPRLCDVGYYKDEVIPEFAELDVGHVRICSGLFCKRGCGKKRDRIVAASLRMYRYFQHREETGAMLSEEEFSVKASMDDILVRLLVQKKEMQRQHQAADGAATAGDEDDQRRAQLAADEAAEEAALAEQLARKLATNRSREGPVANVAIAASPVPARAINTAVVGGA